MRSALIAILSAVLLTTCARRPPTDTPPKAAVEVSPAPLNTVEVDDDGLQLSAPASEWQMLVTSRFSVAFPPGWQMKLKPQINGWACSAKEHLCFLKAPVEIDFGPEELLANLKTRAGVRKMMTTVVDGDVMVVWTMLDDDGDPWISAFRFHGDGAFYLGYFIQGAGVPDDFFVILTSLSFPEPKVRGTGISL